MGMNGVQVLGRDRGDVTEGQHNGTRYVRHGKRRRPLVASLDRPSSPASYLSQSLFGEGGRSAAMGDILPNPLRLTFIVERLSLI
jgi:hypothetical protein